MKTSFNPTELATKELHQLIIGSIAPRPIAFVSTMDEKGNLNLAPYSFFNAFSSNPPILVFSSNRRVSDNSTKDTLHNVMKTKQAVINVVSYDIVRQMSLASVEFPSDTSEFDKIGLTPQKSKVVQVPGVVESPVNMECKVKDIITLGEHGGAGHLIICEVVHITISEDKFTNGKLDPHKLDLMGRLGRNYYVRASGAALMEIYQSVVDIPLGFDRLPEHIKKSSSLTGNDIGILAALKTFPEKSLFDKLVEKNSDLNQIANPLPIHQIAKQWIDEGKIEDAFALLYHHPILGTF